MNKKMSVFFLSIILFSLVSSHGYNLEKDYKEKIREMKYFPEKNNVISKISYINDDDDWHSTYKYRHKYSYKKTKDTSKKYYYEYVPYLRKYEKKSCYSSPPKGKLFYVKCP